VLTDDKQKELYDQYGHAGVDPSFQGGNPFEGFNMNQDGSFHFSSSGGQQIDPEELFDMFFGGGGGRRRPRGPRRGSDLQMQVHLSFREAVFGVSKDLSLRYQVIDRRTGEAEIKERDVTVEVPPGIDTGMNLRLQGQGAEGEPGAEPGNLLVQVSVEQDNFFHRDGYDVHTEVPISVGQAILGGTVDVQTLTGEVEMKIPKGCQPDTKLMLRGKGIQELHGSRKGNQVAHLKIVIPTQITSRQEELIREFDEEKACEGVTGKIAHAAETAFERLFGSNKKHDDADEEEDDKRQAAE